MLANKVQIEKYIGILLMGDHWVFPQNYNICDKYNLQDTKRLSVSINNKKKEVRNGELNQLE